MIAAQFISFFNTAAGCLALAEDVVDRVSRLLDETSLRFLALRRGTTLLSRAIRPGEDIVGVLRSLCADKLCLARVDGEGLEGTLLIWRGTIAASYSRLGGVETSGSSSLRTLMEAASRGGRLTVFELPQSEFASIYGDVVRLLEGVRPRVPTEAPPVRAPSEKEREDIALSIARLARSLDLPVASASVLIEGRRAHARFVLAGDVRYSFSLALLVIKELATRGLQVSEVEVAAEPEGARRPAAEGRRVALRVEVENLVIMRVLAAIAEISIERGIYVEKLEYRVRRGLWRGEHLLVELTVVYPWSRIASLSPDSYWKIPEELAREAQRRIQRIWGDRVEVLVRTILQTPQGPLWYEGRAAP